MGCGGLVPTTTRTPTRDSRITAPSASACKTLPPGLPASVRIEPALCGPVELGDVDIGPIAHLVTITDRDEGQVAVEVVIVQPVSEDESVVELHASVANRLGNDAPRRAIEQCTHVESARSTRGELRRQIREGEACIDDVFDDHDVASADVDLDVLRDAYATRVGREPRDRDEVDFDGDVGNRAREIGDEQERALEHTDEHDT